MKKLISLLFIICLINTAFQCDSPTPRDAEGPSTCDNSDWLNTAIVNAEKNGNKGEIIRYRYNGNTVYWVDLCIGCADDMVVVYSCAGETLCQFGGIAGLNTCPDFQDKALDKKIIWSN